MTNVTSLNSTARIKDAGPGPYGTSGGRLATLTASATLDDSHDDKTVLLDAAAGLTVTLPTATGSGWRTRIVIKTTVTSNNYIIQVNNSTDVCQGMVQNVSDDPATVKGFITSSSSDTLTLNGTTTGGLFGAVYEIQDVKSGFFQVMGRDTATGTEATPWSAAV